MILKETCNWCGKAAREISRKESIDYTIVSLACGHIITEKKVHPYDYSTIKDVAKKKSLFPFQSEDCSRAAKANFRVLFNHEMGCGKTIIDCALLKAHPDLLQPAVFIVKGSLSLQFFQEIYNWTGIISQVLKSGKDVPIPGFKAYIVSYDLLGKMDFSKLAIKGVFIDECQYIKNGQTSRAKAVAKFCEDKKHILATSNSPIKNNAKEYFTILNILDRRNFHSETAFINDYVDYYNNGYSNKFGGLSQHSAKRFKAITDPYIFRRTRAEVLPDLPKIWRQSKFVDLEENKGAVNTSAEYEKTANKFALEFDGDLSIGSAGIAALSRMRHLCGLGKIEPAIEYITDFLINTDRKITIFVHHKDVGTLLRSGLENGPCSQISKVLQLTSEMSMEQRFDTVEEFKKPENRILVASTLASGEGLNLQFCSDAIILERQWNPANEEQAEGRFPRPGSEASQVNITYFLAIGTIDEWLSELVEQKREYVSKTLDGTGTVWSESSLMKELAEKLVSAQRKKWSMK